MNKLTECAVNFDFDRGEASRVGESDVPSTDPQHLDKSTQTDRPPPAGSRRYLSYQLENSECFVCPWCGLGGMSALKTRKHRGLCFCRSRRRGRPDEAAEMQFPVQIERREHVPQPLDSEVIVCRECCRALKMSTVDRRCSLRDLQVQLLLHHRCELQV